MCTCSVGARRIKNVKSLHDIQHRVNIYALNSRAALNRWWYICIQIFNKYIITHESNDEKKNSRGINKNNRGELLSIYFIYLLSQCLHFVVYHAGENTNLYIKQHSTNPYVNVIRVYMKWGLMKCNLIDLSWRKKKQRQKCKSFFAQSII